MSDKQLEVLARDLVIACGRMLDNWAEADQEVRTHDLWMPLHRKAEELRELLEKRGVLPP